MSRIHRLHPGLAEPAEVLGGKGRGLVELQRLGLPVPPGFVIDTGTCREFLRTGELPAGFDTSLAGELRELAPRPVAVRSGAAVSMPGMMTTILGVGPTVAEVRPAVQAVFESWHTPRATTYRELHGIPHDGGTAVVIQAMIHGDRDDHSGSGVAFSRDPSNGIKIPYGEVLFRRPGVDVVAGRSVTQPLAGLAAREPAVWRELCAALEQIERHYRDVCHVEFTFESGRLWFLQVRPGGLAGRAAVRVAVDLVDEGIIDRRTALARITPQQLRSARTRRLATTRPAARPGPSAVPASGLSPAPASGLSPAPASGLSPAPAPGEPVVLLTRGTGAVPGTACGRVAVTAAQAVRMAAAGPVILVRPHTSPADLPGLAAAAGVVTALGGPASHAAVVARAMGKPAVVAATALTVDPSAEEIRVGDRVVPAGTLIAIDGTGGDVVLGDPGTVAAEDDPHLSRLLSWRAAPG